MQCYPIPVPSLNTAQQYAETAGSLAEALHELFLRRPCIRTDPANPGAQAAYYRAVGAWYMEQYHSRRPYGLSPAVRWCRP